MRYLILMIGFCWAPLVWAQKDNKRALNQVFSYQEVKYFKDNLYIVGQAKPLVVDAIGPFYQGYIWIRANNSWQLIDSLQHKLVDSTQTVSSLKACANGKNTWAHTREGWVLFSYKGAKLTEAYEYFTDFSKDWYILYKNEHWLLGNQEGKTGTKTFSGYKALNPDKNMLMISPDGNSWKICDATTDEWGQETYTSFHAHNEYVLVEKENRSWSCIKVDHLAAKETPIEGKPWIAGDTASGFFTHDKTGWKLYAYTQPQKIIRPYDSVVFNQINQTSFALKNNQWKLVNTKGEEEICLKKNELPYLLTPTNPSSIERYQRAKVTAQVEKDFYSQGLDPEKFASFKISRPVTWYGDPCIYLFEANNKTGLCNMETNQVSTLPLYNDISVLSSGYYKAVYALSETGYSNDAEGIIDRNGKILIPFHYISIIEKWNERGTGRIFICELALDVYDFYDEQGKKMNEQPVFSKTAIWQDSRFKKSCGQYVLLTEAKKEIPAQLYTFTWNENTGRYTMETSNDQQKIKTVFNTDRP